MLLDITTLQEHTNLLLDTMDALMVLMQEGLPNTAQRAQAMELIHQQDITTLQLQTYLQQYH